MMLGPVGNTSVSLEDRLVTVFAILTGLTGVATLIQVGRRISCTYITSKKLRLRVVLSLCNPWFSSTTRETFGRFCVVVVVVVAVAVAVVATRVFHSVATLHWQRML